MNIHTHFAGYTPSWSSFSQPHATLRLENLRGSKMDSVFLLTQEERAAFLQHMMQTLGCTHICLWSYLPQPPICLLYLDGLYNEIRNVQQPSSSAGSLANRLFHAYSQSVTYVDQNRRIPGFAFKNNLPYMELAPNDFRRMASSEVQLQFYQEAGIKSIVLMGCAAGEIELGISTQSKVDVESELKNWFPVDFARQTVLPPTNRSQTTSPSSSSLRSLSADSSAQSPLLFNIPATSFVPELPKEGLFSEELLEDVLRSSVSISAPIASTSHHQVNETLSQPRNIQFPSRENEDAAMTNAILAVLSSSSPSISSTPPNLPPFRHRPTAFTNYRAALSPIGMNRIRKQNMFRRAVSFFRNLNESRIQEQQNQGSRPTTTQLHHMISERRRREKLNDSFQILRSLLPPGSKKDKATVLSKTTEYLSSLKLQVDELSRRNQILESQNVSSKEEIVLVESSSNERVNVEMEHVASSSASQERLVDLRVRVRGECSLLDLVTRLMELLKQERNVTLVSLQSSTRIIESVEVHGITLRLRIEDGATLEEAGFEEAVKRALDHQ